MRIASEIEAMPPRPVRLVVSREVWAHLRALSESIAETSGAHARRLGLPPPDAIPVEIDNNAPARRGWYAVHWSDGRVEEHER